MANIPPTKKEKMIMKVLVKRFSKKILFQELVHIQSQGMISDMVRNSSKLVGIDVHSQIDGQYLNYAIDNYDKIQNNDFPDQFERMMTLEATITATEIRKVKADYTITYPVLKSFSDELKKDIDDNMWDYDPKFIDDDTVDTDVRDIEFFFDKIVATFLEFDGEFFFSTLDDSPLNHHVNDIGNDVVEQALVVGD